MTVRRPLLTVTAALLLTYVSMAVVHGTIEPVGYLAWGDSMEPHVSVGDAYVQTSPERFAEEYSVAGVVTAAAGERHGYRSFGGYGDVVVFPVEDNERWVHRAITYVEEGESWRGANDTYVAEQEGFITAGDNNSMYDQEPEIGIDPVPPDDVHVKALEPPGEPSVKPVLESRVCEIASCVGLPAPTVLLERVTSGL